ncbi:MAG TPA: DUF2141 domain-containing protein [Sphingomonas sp.]|nr:DUF2141 domain-containing protein [Sphingomonas sp.]
MAVVAAALPPDAALVVEVSNVRNGRGHVHVDLCPEGQFLTDNCQIAGNAPARPGVTIVTFRNVPPGRYAAQVFHDENDDKKVDRALFGIPKEGVGFSRDAPIRLSAPKWGDAAFDHVREPQVIRLRMRYFLGPSGPAPAAH